MTNPRRFLLRMIVFLACVGVVLALLLPGLQRALFTNLYLNALIIGVFVFGMFYNFRQVLVLGTEVNWIEQFRGDRAVLSDAPAPRLLAPMAAMLRERRGRLSLSAPAMRSRALACASHCSFSA